MKLSPARLLLSTPAAMFYCFMAVGLAGDVWDRPGAALAGLVGSTLLRSSVGCWVLADARTRGKSLPHDFGTFVYVAGPVLVPIYLFQTRGWRAFIPIGQFALLYLAAAAVDALFFFLKDLIKGSPPM